MHLCLAITKKDKNILGCPAPHKDKTIFIEVALDVLDYCVMWASYQRLKKALIVEESFLFHLNFK